MECPRPEAGFDYLAARLPALPPTVMRAAAGAGLLAGIVTIAWRHPWIGGGLLLVGFLADGLALALLRRVETSARPLLPFGLLAAPFGFALTDPAWALAAMFLMFALSVHLLLCGVPLNRVRLIHWLAAAGLLLACVLPDRFSIIAYLVGIACFASAGQGLGATS